MKKTLLRMYKKTDICTPEQFKTVGDPFTDFLKKVEGKSSTQWRQLIKDGAVKINDFKITNPGARYMMESTDDAFILHILE